MSNIDTRVSVTCDDDDPPPPAYNVSQPSAEVKKKPICPSFHILLLIIFGTLCVLLGTIDMIVFSVIPYNKINNNKKKYPSFHFEKPDGGIVALHFLEHLSLIALGGVLLGGINPNFFESFYFTIILILLGSIFGSLYFIEALYAGLVINMIKKEDFKLSEITEKLNYSNPINAILFYIRGSKRVRKGKYKTCYSKNGVVIPVQSSINSRLFSPNENIPDFFYLEITQKVNLSIQLFELASKFREKISFCKDQYYVAFEYHPLFQGRNLVVSDGKKIPANVKKPTGIASTIFGLGAYPELMQKSIPIKKYDEDPNVDIIPGVDYDTIYASINCLYIGQCQTSNERPHV